MTNILCTQIWRTLTARLSFSLLLQLKYMFFRVRNKRNTLKNTRLMYVVYLGFYFGEKSAEFFQHGSSTFRPSLINYRDNVLVSGTLPITPIYVSLKSRIIMLQSKGHKPMLFQQYVYLGVQWTCQSTNQSSLCRHVTLVTLKRLVTKTDVYLQMKKPKRPFSQYHEPQRSIPDPAPAVSPH